MPSALPQSAAPLLAQHIDHYFDLALYLLVVTGFTALSGTGGLDLPSMLFVLAALAVRGYFLAQRLPIVISERWTTPLTLAYFVFFAADYFVVSHSFLPATVHLALFAVIVRMFSLRRERDYVMLAILAFLMILASAVLTVDSVFLFSFAFFMLMAVATFVLLEMRRSERSATLHARPSNDPMEHRRLAFSLTRVAVGLVIMILFGAGALFFLLPRRSGGYLGGYAFGTDFSSGFSDHVQLGQIGQIQQSNAVVMHVEIDGDRAGRYDMRWRGVALGDFDGHTWSKPREQFTLERWPDNSFVIPHLEKPLPSRHAPANPLRENTIHYRVLMEPIGTNVFFLAPWARSISGVYQLLATDSAGAIYNFDTQHTISRYEAESDVATPSAAELRAAGQNYPPEVTGSYLQLPALDQRIDRLAAQITLSATTDYDKAALLETYLRTRYQYTLELPRVSPADPIANFLFERKQGHCEYFASSMAVMLRTLGIPSRVVNGFRSDEFNDLTANYVVRAKDAHAWVEAYFPGYGWQSFDPTPGGGSSTPRGWARAALYVDAMASFWREWIVSYDTSHQYVIGQAAINRTHNLWESVRGWGRDHYDSMLEWAHRTEDRAQHSPAKCILGTVGFSFLFLLLRNRGRIVRLVQEYRLRAHPERSPEQAAAMWYGQMARALARRGLQKPAAATPREFVEEIDDMSLREPVARFTEVYEAARFGDSSGDAGRLPALFAAIEIAIRNH
jgi:transglutaminase-like putative cysteine protease